MLFRIPAQSCYLTFRLAQSTVSAAFSVLPGKLDSWPSHGVPRFTPTSLHTSALGSNYKAIAHAPTQICTVVLRRQLSNVSTISRAKRRHPASHSSLLPNTAAHVAAFADSTVIHQQPHVPEHITAAGVVVRDSSGSKGRYVVPKPPAQSSSPAAATAKAEASSGSTASAASEPNDDKHVLDYFSTDSSAEQEQLLLSTAALAGLASNKRIRHKGSTADASAETAEILLAQLTAEQAASRRPKASRSSRGQKHVGHTAAVTSADGTDQQLGRAVTIQQQPAMQAATTADVDHLRASKIIQLAQKTASRRDMPMEALSAAITKALELARLQPHLDASELLHPAIVNMQLSYANQQVTRFKRLLPDTKLKAEILDKDPRDVSDKIARVVTAFRSQLSMQPPSQVLSDAWTFVKALRLPDYTLASHLKGLLHLASGNLARAQSLAQRYAGVLVSSSWLSMMKRVHELRDAMQLSQDQALEFALRYPYLLRTKKQLQHVEQMIKDAPALLGLSTAELLPILAAHPQLFKYKDCNELAAKYNGLTVVFTGLKTSNPSHTERSARAVTPAQVLTICAAESVRQAATAADVVDTIRTSTAVAGYTEPSELLPILLQMSKDDPLAKLPTKASMVAKGSAAAVPATVITKGKRQRLTRTPAALLQPADKLIERVAALRQLQGMTLDDFSKEVRWTRASNLHRDPRTQFVKLMLLQRHLLGLELPALGPHDETLAPQMTKMLTRCPMVAYLKFETCYSRLTALETSLNLQQGEAGKLVLRVPQVLLLQASSIQQSIQALQQYFGDIQRVKQLVTEDPRVLLLQHKASTGGCQAQLSMLQSLLSEQQEENINTIGTAVSSTSTSSSNSVGAEVHQQRAQVEDERMQPLTDDAAAAATAAAAAAVSACAVRAASSGAAAKHGSTGIRFRANAGSISKQWEVRSWLVYGKPHMYCSRHGSELEAAAKFDLVRLALKGPGMAVNLPEDVYTADAVAAVQKFLKLKQQQHLQRQQQSVLDGAHTPGRGAGQLPSVQCGNAEDLAQVQTEAIKQQQEHQQPPKQQRHLLMQCLQTQSGRALLSMKPDTTADRLQFLSETIGTSQSKIVQQALVPSSPLRGLLALPIVRLQNRAAQLQEQLKLSTQQLQTLLKVAPELLVHQSGTIEAKLEMLLPSFRQICTRNGDATAALKPAAVADVSSPAEEEEEEQHQQLQPRLIGNLSDDAGLAALQRAVVRAPRLLLLSADRVVERLRILQQCCQYSDDLAVQVQHAVDKGTLGGWLTAGDKRFAALQALLHAVPATQQEQHQHCASRTRKFRQRLVPGLSQLLRGQLCK